MSGRRSIVEISSTVGKAENSSGRSMNKPTIRMRTEKVIDSARLISSSQVGIGRMSTDRIATTPSASAISPRFSDAAMLGDDVRSGSAAAVMSAMADQPASEI